MTNSLTDCLLIFLRGLAKEPDEMGLAPGLLDQRVFHGHPNHGIEEYQGYFVCTLCVARAKVGHPVFT